METLGIVGAGSVGQAFGRLLAPHFRLLISSRRRAAEAAGFAGSGARAATLEKVAQSSDCILVAVPDSAVSRVARELSSHEPAVVLHTCGSQGPEGLQPLPEAGTSCATFHPLQTFPDPRSGATALPGSFVGVCGHGTALDWCRRLGRLLGAEIIVVAEDRLPLYHAAAVLASNCTVGLLHAASEVMEHAGVRRDLAFRAFRPLIEASLANAITMYGAGALTGPVARGDSDTVRRHLESLNDCPAPLRALYRDFGQYLVTLALRRGLPPRRAEELRTALGGNS